MRNAIKTSVHTKSVTSLNMIFPILPSTVNQSFTKSAYKLIHSSQHLSDNNIIRTLCMWGLVLFTLNCRSVLHNTDMIRTFVCMWGLVLFTLNCRSVLHNTDMIRTLCLWGLVLFTLNCTVPTLSVVLRNNDMIRTLCVCEDLYFSLWAALCAAGLLRNNDIISTLRVCEDVLFILSCTVPMLWVCYVTNQVIHATKQVNHLLKLNL